ncbi:MAG: Holliday junction branch migration DNA helicase RuvB [Rickettsiales bacterium]|jgi:Holliday junction DNA helicase RuvB|nr:Holliday junction branch migration DNA helicase RuvB [Rickettsiales bacterium]
MSNNELLDPEIKEDGDNKLRPLSFNEFIGQNKLKENAQIYVKSAIKREDSLDHVLLYGPPGLGKTTLAQIIANEMGSSFKSTAGPILAKSGDLAAILTSLNENDVLFIDEIHRLNTSVEEILYSAMEDFNLDIVIGEGPSARSIKIDLPKFTLVGATTRIGLISNPLRDRFGIPFRLEFYEPEDLEKIIMRASSIIKVDINKEGAGVIARRCRGTPRIALRILKRVRDYALVYNYNVINDKITDIALNEMDVDHLGLDSGDRKYLSFIADNYAGGPVGIETISAGLAEQKDNIEETIEPFLIQLGLIQRTPRGRMLTAQAFEHIS